VLLGLEKAADGESVMITLTQFAQIAQCCIPLVALGALGFAWAQLRLNRNNQRETTAKTTFREFLKITVEHPELAEGDYQSLVKTGKKEKYEWFVGYFLWATEEMLEYGERDPTWRYNLEMVASRHSEYFKTPEFQSELPGYNNKIRSLVAQIIQQSA
jgi:hypothetical protein